MDLVVHSFFVMKEYVSSVKFELSVWVIDQNSLVREVWMLSFSRDEDKRVPREFVINAEV